jgi:hypothetical protein
MGASSEEREGPEFEARGLEIARSIHDPLGLQGPIIYSQKERDGLFIDHSSIHAFEFTTRRDKAKARQDATKIVELLRGVSRERVNRFKTLQGWFVTKDEPTPDQRTVVQEVAKSANVSVFAVSLATLQQQICDIRGYLNKRDLAPFGSTAYNNRDERSRDVKITPQIRIGSAVHDPKSLAEEVSSGARLLILGEFGVGKSYLLKSVYENLRKSARRGDVPDKFPIHVNLRDCVNLRTPAEIIRRHAEDIGFNDSSGLISAWMSGAAILLLDGFDEVIPARSMGPATNLRQVRWEALSAVRRLIQESPRRAGILVCGRSHYFSSEDEMMEDLGFNESDSIVSQLDDFTPEQLKQYVEASGFRGAIPEWIPSRPLLVSYLVSSDSASEALSSIVSGTPAQTWRELFLAICARESMMYTAVMPATIEKIIARVATLARARGDRLGPIEMAQMEQAFYEINGYQPDREGTQLLLRLPGLAVTEPTEGNYDARVFVDRDLASVAYGADLAEFVSNPFETKNPLSQPAAWVTASDELTIETAAMALADNVNRRAVLALADRRQDAGFVDAVLADLVALIPWMDGDVKNQSYLIEGVLFENVAPGDSNDILPHVNLKNCVIETLDLSAVTSINEMPTISSSLIGFVDGVEAIPPWMQNRFIDCTIDGYANAAATTAGILRLGLDDETAVALTILKKVYRQRGSGRKEQSLYRGLDQAKRGIASNVIQTLVSQGWILKAGSGDRAQYIPVKEKRADALAALETPATFRW